MLFNAIQLNRLLDWRPLIQIGLLASLIAGLAPIPLPAGAVRFPQALIELGRGGPTQGFPTQPEAVPLELDAASTALLLVHMNVSCGNDPSCRSLIEPAQHILDRARSSNVLVVYTTMLSGAPPIL